MTGDSTLNARVARAFVWVAAFCLATGVFFSLTLTFNALPPTPFVAVGPITIQRYAKIRDYLGAGLFFALVPPLTIWFQRLGTRAIAAEQRRLPRAGASAFAPTVAIAFAVPFFLSPLLYLTTGKFGWILVLPLALAWAAARTLTAAVTSTSLQRLFRRELFPYHALLFAEASSWVLYRYIVTGRRIAHYPTLFLEGVFIALFVALFWGVALLISRLTAMSFGVPEEEGFRRIATAAVPFILLPVAAIVLVPTAGAGWLLILTLLVSAMLAVRLPRPIAADRAWRLAALVMMPVIIYCISYGSTAHLSQWIDLFHRGETLGPASDYLRGKVPYRDVFALHGMLEDGRLDGWLMELFGRNLGISVARSAVLGGLLGVSLWYLGVAIFDSVPLALVIVAMGAWTTAENDRTFFQVAAVALFWYALRRRRQWAAFASGLFAAVSLFFSYDIGLYTIAGAIAAAVAIWAASRFVEWDGMQPARAALLFVAGLAVGSAPFLAYLASHGAAGAFFTVSFVTIPRIIDAVWSLPFPDLVSTFRADLNLHTLADFVLWEKFHLILSPLTIAVAAVYYIQRLVRRRAAMLDHALMVMTVFAAVTQRSAFGRAEFRHQYFAAFLIGPMLVLLVIAAVRVLRSIWSEGTDGSRAFVVTIVLVAIPLFSVLFWIPDLVNARIEDLVNYQRRNLRLQGDPQADEVKQRIDAVTSVIHDLVPAGQPIFDFSDQPAFYFFADRPNPTRFYQVPIASPAEFQAEIITALERTKPRVIIRSSPDTFDEFDGISNNLRAQALAAYIDDCYTFYTSTRGVDLWKRRDGVRPASLQTYLAKIHLPGEKEAYTTGRARMVFPLVGTVGGVNGSFWQSDLTLHNPYREPVYVALRYVSAAGHAERRLRLSPRQTIRWPDVVRTFFGTQGGVGTLWIDYRELRKPVAVLTTSDVAHNGRASLQSPLTKNDTAVANTDSAELTIVGIPGNTASGRRVNLGVVNSGIVPGVFRITARARDGSVVGRPIEAGVAESEVWLVGDAEGELGIHIDESTTIRVTAVGGSCVAFATVTDQTGDTQLIPGVPSQQQ